MLLLGYSGGLSMQLHVPWNRGRGLCGTDTQEEGREETEAETGATRARAKECQGQLQPWANTDLRLTASTAGGEQISIGLSHPVCGGCSPR